MAEFKIAFARTIKFEGGYVNHPNDKGGETYKGIARNFWSNWRGWRLIDISKKVDSVLENTIELQKAVEEFYYNNFWLAINGDAITDQSKANNIFDFAVNSGVKRAIIYAQWAVGVKQDGKLGPKSLEAINKLADFTSKYKQLRLDFVNKIVKNNPSQVVFLKGWTSRIKNA